MFKKILILFAAAVLILVIVVATRPDDFKIERTKTITAPASAIFPHVNDLKKWQGWSPWAKLDSSAKYTYAGPPSGKDSSMHWAGNSNVGEGKMTVIESTPDQLVRFRLDFIKPFPGTNAAEFTFVPEGESTRVTWTMTGKYSFIPKAVGLFLNMDKMMGDMFSQGLDDLAKVAETKN